MRKIEREARLGLGLADLWMPCTHEARMAAALTLNPDQ